MKKFKINTVAAIALYAMLAAVLLCGCQENALYTRKKICKVLKAKHAENISTNIKGDFIVVHYFLYEDGTLEQVGLKDYMSFNVKDIVCWHINVRVK